ncbi:MAG: hypothetical protein LBL46_03040 [Rickettsiales bacterium]|jgi:hypothetical protein|nr:hypothetical protein [Rickettsiales bacterium]
MTDKTKSQIKSEAFETAYTGAMAAIPQTYKDAHEHCLGNWQAVKQSKVCGCFYCGKLLSADAITDFITEPSGSKTAICPECGIDSIIGDASGVELSKDFMNKMHLAWFGDK